MCKWSLRHQGQALKPTQVRNSPPQKAIRSAPFLKMGSPTQACPCFSLCCPTAAVNSPAPSSARPSSDCGAAFPSPLHPVPTSPTLPHHLGCCLGQWRSSCLALPPSPVCLILAPTKPPPHSALPILWMSPPFGPPLEAAPGTEPGGRGAVGEKRGWEGTPHTHTHTFLLAATGGLAPAWAGQEQGEVID